MDGHFTIGFFTGVFMMSASIWMVNLVVEPTSEIIYNQCEEVGVYVYPDSRIIKCETK